MVFMDFVVFGIIPGIYFRYQHTQAKCTWALARLNYIGLVHRLHMSNLVEMYVKNLKGGLPQHAWYFSTLISGTSDPIDLTRGQAAACPGTLG
jgi:hypothetical protein